MKIDMKGPCDSCPFRKDKKFHLRKGRAEDIAAGLMRGESFHCHKTIDYGAAEDPDDRPFNHAEQFCGGALVTLLKQGHFTQMMQIGVRLGVWDTSTMNMDAPVYDDLADFIATMSDE
jgi:hypothetical protein